MAEQHAAAPVTSKFQAALAATQDSVKSPHVRKQQSSHSSAITPFSLAVAHTLTLINCRVKQDFPLQNRTGQIVRCLF